MTRKKQLPDPDARDEFGLTVKDKSVLAYAMAFTDYIGLGRTLGELPDQRNITADNIITTLYKCLDDDDLNAMLEVGATEWRYELNGPGGVWFYLRDPAYCWLIEHKIIGA